MRAISLWQPWASLLVNGEKKIETRSWPIKGPFPQVVAIHAAKKWDMNLKKLCRDDPFRESLIKCGWCRGDLLSLASVPLGAIVGFVKVFSCIHTEYLNPDAKEKAFGDFGHGRFGWICESSFALPTSIPCVGRQGFFNVELPPSLILPELVKVVKE